ncbi:LysM peptidoglycan-binding domain-containing protein [Arthrobacter sp. UNC362MFTsu5.1]|uniref:LysM peptidoglycan-binding domain-containing protein n=1 Tax=Arthrobacter sp. UNC362MFTsu5.1 TaxID=1449044 RepID=UPI000484390D|nr:LysM peptidoglycan-binding domain-containing protein [Arthrobacter sp. UNC362MFTsu5.1]
MSVTSAIHGSRHDGSAKQGLGHHGPESPMLGFNWEERPVVKAAKTRSSQPPLRLTRRGRIVLVGIPLILLSVLLISLAGFLNSPAKAADSATELSLTPTVSVTVQPGQSLWEIAGSVAPERDPRDVVADIVQLNNLDGGRVMPGQQIFVPSN